MNELGNIGLKNLRPGLPGKRTDNAAAVPGKAFDQLLQTVQKLENMEGEIDAAMQSTAMQNAKAVNRGVHTLSNYIKSIEGMVEDFSMGNRPGHKSAGYGISQYEQGKAPSGD